MESWETHQVRGGAGRVDERVGGSACTVCTGPRHAERPTQLADCVTECCVASFPHCLQGTDNSEEYAKQLVQPALGSPPQLGDLQRFLTEPPAAQIPIIANALDAAILTPARRLHFVAALGQLARAVAVSMTAPLPPGDSEACTVITEHLVVVSLLLELDKALPTDLCIGYEGKQVLCVTHWRGAVAAWLGLKIEWVACWRI